MTIYWFDHIEAVASLIAPASVLLAARRSLHQWPVLALYAAISFLHALACSILQYDLARFPRLGDHPVLYAAWFHTYWIGLGATSFVGMFIIAEAAYRLPLAGSIPSNLRRTFVVGAITIGVGVSLLAFDRNTTTFPLTSWMLLLQKSLAVLWCMTSSCVVVSIYLFGLSWSAKSCKVALGCLLQGISFLITSHFSNIHPELNRNLTLIQAFITAGVMLLWATSIRSADVSPSMQSTPSQQWSALLLNAKTKGASR